jgi:hypothetical protein
VSGPLVTYNTCRLLKAEQQIIDTHRPNIMDPRLALWFPNQRHYLYQTIVSHGVSFARNWSMLFSLLVMIAQTSLHVPQKLNPSFYSHALMICHTHKPFFTRYYHYVNHALTTSKVAQEPVHARRMQRNEL